MKAPAFAYHAPRTTGEVIDLLGRLDNARVLGGGQSLMPMMNLRVAAPDHLIDLGHIPDLVGIEESPSALSIGAMTTQRAIEQSALVRGQCPLLAEAVDHIGHQQTRNRGTIGGSLCHLDPGAELPVVAAALDARLTIEGPAGRRNLPFADFPMGYLTSALKADEILVRIDFPTAGPRSGSAFLEFNRRPADFAIVSIAVQLAFDNGGHIAWAAIACGGVHYAPIRMAAAQAALLGCRPDADMLESVVRALPDFPCDGDDLYPADFRQEICRVLLKRALTLAVARAGGRHG